MEQALKVGIVPELAATAAAVDVVAMEEDKDT